MPIGLDVKYAVDRKSGLATNKVARFANARPEERVQAAGIAGDPSLEAQPRRFTAQCEKEINAQNNAFIVSGRDRISTPDTGYGGRGDTQCGMLDIVVGLGAPNPIQETSTGEEILTNPNFRTDAARIYISQKTDPDKNFGLVRGKIGNFEGRSAIVVKADAVRIIGREGIKLVTTTDRMNSQGGEIMSIRGIDLIAGNRKGSQPIPKGANLKQALEEMVERIDNLSGLLDHIILYQVRMQKALITHTHYSPFHGLPTSPSPQLMQEMPTVTMNHTRATANIALFKINLAALKMNYLNMTGKKYINSMYNTTN